MPFITSVNKTIRLKTLKTQIDYIKQQFNQNRKFDIEKNTNISLFEIEELDKELKFYEKIEKMIDSFNAVNKVT